MSYQPDQHQLWALSTWQKTDDPNNDAVHALMGLAGEAGEIVDQYKKHLFKSGKQATREQFLDELGDLYFYLRIVAHIAEKDMAWIGKGVNGYVLSDTIQVVIDINYMAALMLVDWFTRRIIDTSRLRLIYCGLVSRLEQLNCSIDELAELNRQKLLDGHGWKKRGEVITCPYCQNTQDAPYPFEHVRFRCQTCQRQFTLAYVDDRWIAKQVVKPEELR